MAKITYDNKIQLNENANIPNNQKCRAVDMNEIKNIVNGNDDEFIQYKSNIAAGETYSTDEVKTNKVWIDGKPIYRKVVSAKAPSKAATWVAMTSGLNANEILSYTGYVEFSNSEHKLLANGTSQFTYFQLNKGTHELYCATNDTGFFGKNIKIIIEYTKTTD